MVWHRGRAPLRAPGNHRGCVLRTTELVAPLVLDALINGSALRAWAQQMLVPELQPGDMVVLDNFGSHKVVGIAEPTQAARAQLHCLPPDRPDFNPIEQVFAKLKTLLGKAAKRTVDALWAAIGELLDRFPRQECKRCIAMPATASQIENARAGR